MVNLAFCGLTWLSFLTKFELLPFGIHFLLRTNLCDRNFRKPRLGRYPWFLLLFCAWVFFFVSKEYHTFFQFARWDTHQMKTFVFVQNTDSISFP